MQRTIKVTGKANLNISPDQTVVRLELKNKYDDYEEALLKSNEETKEVKDLIASYDINRKDIKTIKFNVESKYESYKDKNGDYKSRFIGYGYSHILEFSFDNDNKLLGRILRVLSRTKNVYDVRVKYTVKDKEEAKNKLLKKAVQDAISKAEIIADASNVRLGNIVTIDYSVKEYDYDMSPYGREYERKCYFTSSDDLDMDITPEDIELNDHATVIFEIF